MGFSQPAVSNVEKMEESLLRGGNQGKKELAPCTTQGAWLPYTLRGIWRAQPDSNGRPADS